MLKVCDSTISVNPLRWLPVIVLRSFVCGNCARAQTISTGKAELSTDEAVISELQKIVDFVSEKNGAVKITLFIQLPSRMKREKGFQHLENRFEKDGNFSSCSTLDNAIAN